MPGRAQGAQLELAEGKRLAGLDRVRRAAVARALAGARHQVALDRTGHHLQVRPARAQLVDLADMVEVMVCQQHVRRTYVEAFGRFDQRLYRAPRVDEERGPSLAVAHQLGVGQEARMCRALDDHCTITVRHGCTKPGPPDAARRRRPPPQPGQPPPRPATLWGGATSRRRPSR